MDSALWSSAARTPGIDHVLGFDAEEGSIAFVDTRGLPGRIDLRLGTVATASKAKLAALTTADGSTIYGVQQDGAVVRLTPAGRWGFKPPRPAREVFPQPDGSVLVAAPTSDGTMLWRMRPPETDLVDTAKLPRARSTVRTQVGDRLYLTVDSGLVGVRSRDLSPVQPVRLRRTVRSLVPTPSGDRLYLLTDSSTQISVVDRYRERMADPIELPGPATELRMDPLGRLLLARSAHGDSAWVVAIGTDHLIGAVAGQWRADLPFIAPDGSVAVVRGGDVVLVNPQTLRPARVVHGGAADFWYFFFWDGFRPRDAALDQPVTFTAGDSADTTRRFVTGDSAAIVRAEPGLDTGTVAPQPATPVTTETGAGTIGAVPPPPGGGLAPPTPSTGPPAPPRADTAGAARSGGGFTVQFAALLSESKARELAASITSNGRTPRVVPSTHEGATIYRVVLGPFATRGDAERAGRDGHHAFWVYEGTP
jgi:hypothetical protein